MEGRHHKPFCLFSLLAGFEVPGVFILHCFQVVISSKMNMIIESLTFTSNDSALCSRLPGQLSGFSPGQSTEPQAGYSYVKTVSFSTKESFLYCSCSLSSLRVSFCQPGFLSFHWQCRLCLHSPRLQRRKLSFGACKSVYDKPSAQL